MMIRKSLSAMILVVLTSVSGRIHAQTAAVRFDEGVSSVTVPVEIMDNIIYLPMMMNGKKPVSMILDTGAGGIIGVRERIVRELGLDLVNPFPMGGAGSEQRTAYQVLNAGFSLPHLELTINNVIAFDLTGMDEHWGKRKDGVIGGVFLQEVITVIDYQKHVVEFHDPETYEMPDQGHVIPLLVNRSYLDVRVRIFLYGREHPVEGIMLVDTGLRPTSFNSPFCAEHSLAQQSPRVVHTVTGYGFGGLTMGNLGRIKALEMGDLRIDEPVVDLSEDTEGALASPHFAGILGANILGRFRLILDYKNRIMILQESPESFEPYEYDMSGIWWRCEGPEFNRFIIHHIVEDSPAHEAGLKPEDRLLSIDGMEAGLLNREKLMKMLRHDGKTVQLRYQRDGRILETRVLLRRMI